MVNPTNTTILFLYMVPETGHQKAAEAIMAAVSHMDPRVECVGIEAGTQTFPLIGNMFNKMYLQMLKRAPAVWDYLYDNPDVEEITRDAREFLTLISSFRTRKTLKKYRPVAVVCTQAAPAIAFSAERKKGNLKVPLICVVTDFGSHTYWHHKEVDLYLVGHEDVKKEMVSRGIEEHKIKVTGIPILPHFGETPNMLDARRRLKLHPNKKTILLMGGSHGMGSLDELLEALLTIPLNFQVIVVCGRNRRLHRKMIEANRGAEGVHIYGYVKDLSVFMSASDLIVTKPGGLTCAEALAMQLPLLITNPIPGQEERNVRFLTKHQVAQFVRTPEDLIHAASDLLRHPKKLLNMRQRAKLISKPHSSWEAARMIFDAIHKF